MKAKFLIPLLAFGVLVVFLAMGLGLNPRDVPSPLITREEGRMLSDIPLFYKWSVVNCQRLTIYAIVISRMA